MSQNDTHENNEFETENLPADAVEKLEAAGAETPEAETPPKLGGDFSAIDEVIENEPEILYDDNGPFDPEIHDANSDGSPKYLKGKNIFAKKRGKKKGGAGNTKSPTAPTGEGENISFSPEVISTLAVSGYFQILALAVGAEEAAPITQKFTDEASGKTVTFDEAVMMQQSTKAILTKRGVKSASPEMMLALTMLCGFGARASRPESVMQAKVFGRFLTVRQKMKKLWQKMRRKKSPEPVEENNDNETT